MDIFKGTSKTTSSSPWLRLIPQSASYVYRKIEAPLLNHSLVLPRLSVPRFLNYVVAAQRSELALVPCRVRES
jgi:hypothetical protein